MTVEPAVRPILDAAAAGIPPDRGACLALLGCPPTSPAAGLTRAVADAVSRARFGDTGMLLGQIGIETAPCPGGCGFCVFGAPHSILGEGRLTREELLARADAFTAGGDLYALFLMTMHEFDGERLLADIAAVRAAIPAATQIVVNLGDTDEGYFRALREVGVDGAHHVLRLREGVDTNLDPAQRLRTIDAIRAAGLDWYYCCEPIGPEHSDAELVEQMFLAVDRGCFQHAAMRRVRQPGLPLARLGQISELRLAQVVAVIALASLASPETRSIAVHEPNVLGLCSGANVAYAESGANPRDNVADTAGHRGRDVAATRQLFIDAGYERLIRGDGQTIPLAETPVPA